MLIKGVCVGIDEIYLKAKNKLASMDTTRHS